MDVLSPENLVLDARNALDAGQFKLARELFTRAYEMDPQPDTCQALAAVCFEQGELEAAKTWLKKGLELDPDSVPAFEGLAKIHFELGHLRKAQDYLDEVILRVPDDVSALYSVALIHLDLGEAGPGLRVAERLLALQANNPEFLTLLGRLRRQARKPKEAKEAFNQALAIDDSALEARVQLGWCELDMDQFQPAREAFEAALNLSPRNLDAWKGLARVHLRTHQYEAAIPAIRKVTEIDPSSINAQLDLAEALMESQHRDQAMELVNELIIRAPEHQAVAARAGLYHYRTRELDRAEYLLQKAIVLDPSDADSLEALGCVYVVQKDFNSAMRVFRRVWRMRPLSPKALSNIFMAYGLMIWDHIHNGRLPHVKLGRFEFGGRSRSQRFFALGHAAFQVNDFRRAAMYYRKIRETDQNYEAACAWLAHALLKQGKQDQAIEVCQRGLSRAPASAPLMALLGTLALAQDKLSHAVRILRKSIELDPELGDAWMTLGRALQKEGEFEEALEAYDRALNLHVTDTYLFRHMGDTALALDDRGTAVGYYKRALEVNPRDLVTCQRLIECCYGSRQYDEAIQAAKHAISIDSNAYSAYAWLGRIYRQLQSYNASREAFETAISIRPNLTFLHKQLAALLEVMQLHYEAIESYQRALSIDHDDYEADRGLARAKKAVGMR